ncbi:MAG: thioredoxin family protein [Burkholderiales bacterium]|nr:thioredoxin family protein [Burkholderiales bacterium]
MVPGPSILNPRRAPAASLAAVARAAWAAWAVCAAVFALPAVAATSAVVSTPQVRAELVAHAPEGVAPGKPLRLGLQIDHQRHWHTYWKNPGDSGLPTTLAFTLPAGFVAGDIRWPAPVRLPIGPLMNFGYEGTLLLPVPVQVPAGFSGDSLTVKLRADWLVCKDVCIPEGGDFTLQVPARAATAGHAAAFAAADAATPVPAAGAEARAELKDGALQVRISGLPAAWHGLALQFFPETAGVLNNAAPIAGRWDAGVWSAALAIDPQRSAGPAVLPAVLTAAGKASGLEVGVQVTSAWPPLAQAAPAPLPSLGNATVSSDATAAPAAPTATLGLAMAMLLALAGGVLLNLMPCVFPVLSLKVVGFARHAEDRRKVLAAGLAYTVGVVVSFVALAALLLALRAGGEQIGWGFQLQSPAVVATLAVLFTLIGLNLAGVFEFGSVLPSSVAAARARHPLVDSALTGVLAVAVASPCTAPFMAASLGLALTLPAHEALAIFAALGLGMALPYLAASAWPRLAQALPRPGPWMASFKALMAFPMFATVVWLTWVLGHQTSIDGAAALLGLLVAVAFGAWALGSPTLGRGARRGFAAAAMVLLAAALMWAVPSWRQDAVAATPGAAAAGTPGAGGKEGREAWQPWSAERVAQAQAEGRPVFVDFTAAWCVTCQFNKRATLNHADVLSAFERKRVVLLRADWTRRDATIAAELARLQRSGVPVYALYSPGSAGPRLLSEILTVGELTAALAQLPG